MKLGYSPLELKVATQYGIPLNLVKEPLPAPQEEVNILTSNRPDSEKSIILDFADDYWEKDNVVGFWFIADHLDNENDIVSPTNHVKSFPVNMFPVEKKETGKKRVVVDLSLVFRFHKFLFSF